MNLLEIFEELLPIESPFFVDLITKDEATKKVYIHLGVEKTYRPNNDCATIRQYYERTWEHLNLFEYRCFIKCKLLVYNNTKTGKTEALQVFFSRPNSRFTILFEQRVLELLKIHQCQKSVAKSLKINTQRVEKIFHDYTTAAFEEYIIEPCKKVGIDETSTRKGHNYFTIFVDMEKGKPIDIQDGKGADTIENFFHNNVNPQIVKDISIDMSPSFISGCKNFFSWVEPTFDKWHVYKLLAKHLYSLAKKKTIHYTLKEKISTLWQLLEEFYSHKCFDEAKTQLTFIADYAQDIFGKNNFSNSIRRHFNGILEHIRSKLTNGILEGINSKVQTLKRIAKGFRYIENFKKMIFFVFGIIQPRIPKTT
jgi:transposase